MNRRNLIMNRRSIIGAALAAVLAAAGGYLAFRPAPPASAAAPGSAPAPMVAPLPEQSAAPVAATAAPPAPSAAAEGAAVDAASAYDPEQDDGTIAFRADAGGRLVTDEKARLDLERLHALYTPAERERKLQEAAASLPPAAARRLYLLMDQYVNYMAALHQAYPPDRGMTTVEQGVAQVDGMHGLRVQFFGAEAAHGMFAAEEKLQREMFELMEKERDPSLTMEERAERAQRDYRQPMP
jgi:hypothetical protein